MSMRNTASDRLQLLLDYWKDVCWMTEARVRCILGGVPVLASFPGISDEVPAPVLNWRRFEHTVFDNTVAELSFADWGVTREMREHNPSLDALATFPFEFFEWSRKSRRVFDLPPDLFVAFANATYPEIRWSDVLFPYDSFVITLQQPIEVEDEYDVWSSYDTILVASIPHTNVVTIRLIQAPHAAPNEQQFSQRAKDRFELLMKRGSFEKAKQYLIRQWVGFGIRLKSSPGWRSGVLLNRNSTPLQSRVELEVEDFAARVEPHVVKYLEGGIEENLWRVEPISIAAKIVVGWCLYLESLSQTDLSWKKRERKVHVPGLRGVTGIMIQTDHI